MRENAGPANLILSTKPKILVVDDQPTNLTLFRETLGRAGMEVSLAGGGKECLERVERDLPDLILLDLLMPDMDGWEVCRTLKRDPRLESIPVIMVTASNTENGKLEGLNAGAVDYLSKPIDLKETVARIRTQLRLREAQSRNRELESRVADLRQTVTIGAITHGVAHSLNNLLGIAMGYLELLRRYYDNPEKVMRNSELIDQAVARMAKIVKELGSVAAEESPSLSEIPLQWLLENSVNRFRHENDSPQEVEIDNPLGNYTINANAEIFELAMGNILSNAYESYHSDTADRSIAIQTQLRQNNGAATIKIRVKDEGCGIDKSVADRLFQPFATTKSTPGSGIGLTIARHSIRSLDGDIRILPGENGGTTVEISHPA